MLRKLEVFELPSEELHQLIAAEIQGVSLLDITHADSSPYPFRPRNRIDLNNIDAPARKIQPMTTKAISFFRKYCCGLFSSSPPSQ
jgi:hypothetical protein